MAIAAAHRQRGRKQSHRSHELVDGNPFQHLDVLKGRLGHLRRRRGLTLRKSDNFERPGGALPGIMISMIEGSQKRRGNNQDQQFLFHDVPWM